LTVRIDIHPGATEELEESLAWYAARSEEAARGFAMAVDSAFRKIASDPDRFPRVDRRHRSCNLERYPFQVIFRSEKTRLFVIAIAHAKRRPAYWRHRSP
jgi:plasmid stabilization system protein ParE